MTQQKFKKTSANYLPLSNTPHHRQESHLQCAHPPPFKFVKCIDCKVDQPWHVYLYRKW